MTLPVSMTAFLRHPLVLTAIAGIVFLFIADPAWAAGVGGSKTGLPWEAPLELLGKSISGPVAFVIALLGIIACGATLIWGGEISEFTRRIIYVVLVVCLIVFANSLLRGAMFAGAVIPDVMVAISPIDTAERWGAHAGMTT